MKLAKQLLNKANIDIRLHIVISLIVITIIATLLRLNSLDGPSFWDDEGFSIQAAMSYPRMIDAVHPPLYYIILHGWMRLFNTDFGIRFLSVIFGIAAVPAMFFLGKMIFNYKVGILSALFVALSSFHIMWSQTARMYSMFFLFILITLIMIGKLVKENRTIYWLGYILFVTLLLYSHGIAPFYLIPLNIFFLIIGWPHKTHTIRKWILANIIVIILFLPWIRIYLHAISIGTSDFSIILKKPTFSSLINTIICFTAFGIPSPSAMLRNHGIPINFEIPTVTWSFSFIVLFFYSIYGAFQTNKREIFAFIAFLIVPILGLYITSITFRPIYSHRALIPALISVILLVTCPLYSITKWTHRKLLVVLLIVSVFAFIFSDFYYFRYKRDSIMDWKGMSTHVSKFLEDQDLMIFNTDGKAMLYLFDRYLPNRSVNIRKLNVRDLIPVETVKPEDLDSFGEKIPSAKRIWLVIGYDKIIDPQGLLLNWFEQRYKAIHQLRFNGIKVSLFAIAK